MFLASPHKLFTNIQCGENSGQFGFILESYCNARKFWEISENVKIYKYTFYCILTPSPLKEENWNVMRIFFPILHYALSPNYTFAKLNSISALMTVNLL